MKIVFNCHKESARFSVSPSPGVEEYKIGEDTVRHCIEALVICKHLASLKPEE